MDVQGEDRTAEGADKMKTAMAHNLMNFRFVSCHQWPVCDPCCSTRHPPSL